MEKIIDVCVDLETLSLRPNAAIISIGAKAFDKLLFSSLDGLEFECFVDSTSCILNGMDVDKGTVSWWMKNDEARKYILEHSNFDNIKYAVIKFRDWLEEVKREYEADDIVLWSQGSDFDFPVLKNAFEVCGVMPNWKYRNVRDARGYFLEAMEFENRTYDDPYKLVSGDGVKHTCLSDIKWTIKAIQYAHSLYKNH